MTRRWRWTSAVIRRSRSLAAAVIRGLRLPSAMDRRWRSARDVVRHPARNPPLGQRSTKDVRVRIRVRIERWESHEQDEDQSTREPEGHVVAKKTTIPVPALPSLFHRTVSAVDATRPR